MLNIALNFPQPSNHLMDEQEKTLSYALKLATQAIFNKIKQAAFNQAIVHEKLPFSLYINQLEVYLLVYRTLEHRCKNDEQLQNIWHDKMLKTPALEHDLACLQTEMLNARVQRMTMDFMQFVKQTSNQNHFQALGVLYALEKLSLVHYKLLPHIQNMYDLKGKGITFYRSYDENLHQQWYAFKQRLDTVEVNALAQTDVINSAKQTFERIDKLLDNLWKLRALYQQAA